MRAALAIAVVGLLLAPFSSATSAQDDVSAVTADDLGFRKQPLQAVDRLPAIDFRFDVDEPNR